MQQDDLISVLSDLSVDGHLTDSSLASIFFASAGFCADCSAGVYQ
jgi:hypothetical protein